MKRIKVVAAVLLENNKILATQRGYGEFKDGWELPGGKIEIGESPQEALIREIQEELEIIINVKELITTVEYCYSDFYLVMQCFLCTIESGEMILNEHKAARWLTKRELELVDWLPADANVIGKIKEVLQ